MRSHTALGWILFVLFAAASADVVAEEPGTRVVYGMFGPRVLGVAAATASRFLRRRDSGWTGRGIHWPRAAGGHDVSRIPLALPQRRRTLSNLPAQRLGGDPRPTVDPCIFTAFRQFACSRGGRRGTGLRSSPGVRSMAAATARGGPIACPPQGVPRTGRTIADL